MSVGMIRGYNFSSVGNISLSVSLLVLFVLSEWYVELIRMILFDIFLWLMKEGRRLKRMAEEEEKWEREPVHRAVDVSTIATTPTLSRKDNVQGANFRHFHFVWRGAHSCWQHVFQTSTHRPTTAEGLGLLGTFDCLATGNGRVGLCH